MMHVSPLREGGNAIANGSAVQVERAAGSLAVTVPPKCRLVID
jgi:hypothetical protein